MISFNNNIMNTLPSGFQDRLNRTVDVRVIAWTGMGDYAVYFLCKVGYGHDRKIQIYESTDAWNWPIYNYKSFDYDDEKLAAEYWEKLLHAYSGNRINRNRLSASGDEA